MPPANWATHPLVVPMGFEPILSCTSSMWLCQSWSTEPSWKAAPKVRGSRTPAPPRYVGNITTIRLFHSGLYTSQRRPMRGALHWKPALTLCFASPCEAKTNTKGVDNQCLKESRCWNHLHRFPVLAMPFRPGWIWTNSNSKEIGRPTGTWTLNPGLKRPMLWPNWAIGPLKLAPRCGFEPQTHRLTAGHSTAELTRNWNRFSPTWSTTRHPSATLLPFHGPSLVRCYGRRNWKGFPVGFKPTRQVSSSPSLHGRNWTSRGLRNLTLPNGSASIRFAMGKVVLYELEKVVLKGNLSRSGQHGSITP